MKRNRKVFLLCGILGCCIVGGISQLQFATISSYAESTDKRVEYKYALLGETYTVQSGFLGGTTADGKSISADEKSIYLDWASGEYIFEYSTKIINLKVYETAPEDTITYLSEIPTEMNSGEEIVFPKVSICGNIYRTDGAPAVGEFEEYRLNVKSGDTVLASFKHDEEFAYTFLQGGQYQLQYVYENVFGQVCSFERTINVANKKVFIGVQEQAMLGDTVDVETIQGYFIGQSYPVTAKFISPSNVETVLEGKGQYTYAEKGIYTLQLSCAFGGSVDVMKNYQVTVKTGLTSFVADKEYCTVEGEYQKYSNVEGTNGDYYVMTGSSASFSYNGVVDLRKVGKNNSLFSMLTNVQMGEGVTSVSVTLTDAYDATRAFTVSYTRNSNLRGAPTGGSYDNVIVKVSYGSVTTAFNNYYPLSGGSVSWDTSMHTLWRSTEFSVNNHTKIHPLNFSYDMETNTVYSYGNYRWVERPDGNKQGVDWYEILNMSDSSLPQQFEGFTTGEVYMRVDVRGMGDFALLGLGGKGNTVGVNSYKNNDGILLGVTDLTMQGVIGTAYPIPEATVSPYMQSNASMQLLSPDEQPIAVENGQFIPTQTGEYTLLYSAINAFGFEVERKAIITVLSQKQEIEIEYDLPNLTSAEIFEIPSPSVSGGHGDIHYTLWLDGKPVQVGEKVKVGSTFDLTVRAQDSLGFATERTFSAIVDVNVLEHEINFPRVANCGEIFAIPTAKIYSYQAEDWVEYAVYVGEDKVEGDYVLPATPCNLPFTYKVNGETVASFILQVRKKGGITSVGDFVCFNGQTEMNDGGTTFYVKEGQIISFPYAVSANNLAMEFALFDDTEEKKFDKITYLLTARNGQQLKVSIDGLLSDTKMIYVNDVYTGKTLLGAKGSVTLEGNGKRHYTKFALKYDDVYGGLLLDSKPLCKIDTDLQGVMFDGFGGGAYVDVYIEELVSQNAELLLIKLSNQILSSTAFVSGDIVGPELYSDGCAASKVVEKGYTLSVNSLQAYDVISGEAAITVTLIGPNRQTIWAACSPKDTESVVLNEYGLYKLSIVATDKNSRKTNREYTYTVEDTEAPNLQVDNVQAQKVSLNNKVAISNATAKDNHSAVTITVYIFKPNGQVCLLASGTAIQDITYTVKSTGSYIVRYIATDDSGNVASLEYTITVEKGE